MWLLLRFRGSGGAGEPDGCGILVELIERLDGVELVELALRQLIEQRIADKLIEYIVRHRRLLVLGERIEQQLLERWRGRCAGFCSVDRSR